MAHQVSSQSSGFSPAQPQLIRVPPSSSETPLDLNLSQKVSQNFFKGNEETDASDLHPKSVFQVAPDASTNGFVNLSTKAAFEHTREQDHVQIPPAQQEPNEISGAIPIEHPQSAMASNDDSGVNELIPVSTSGKRKSSRVEVAARVQKELSQSGTAAMEDGSSQGNETLQMSPGQKRKSPRVKQLTPDVAKKVILALEANEDEGLPKPKGRPRGSFYSSKDTSLETPRSRSKSSSAASDAPSDLAERRLLLEERKVRLAEQRFALEEKKLEATIEIGKGLIVSMERMTNTISNLGTPSIHYR